MLDLIAVQLDNDNGPLRPGKYDSDITVFNKQNFPLTVIWKPIEINQENKNNFQAINIQPQSIVNINCAKIFPYSSISNSTLNSRVYRRSGINKNEYK